MYRSVIELINPYDPGYFPEDISEKFGIPLKSVIQLGSNENPYPPSHEVKRAYETAFSMINRYPHPSYMALKEKISEYLGISSENIAVTSGAGEALRHICEIVLDTMDTAVIPVPGYTLYAILAMLRDAIIRFIEFEDYRVRADEILDHDFRLLFLCSPNNPTGNTVEWKEIRKILENSDGIVVVDEAYVEFAGKSIAKRVEEYENLIVVRSFSKFFGLAGMRVGYVVGNQRLIQGIEKVRYPFSISYPGFMTAMAALESMEYYRKVAEKIISERDRMRKELEEIRGFYVYPSETNFLLVKTEMDISTSLEKRGIIIRDITGLMGLEGHHFRITVGLPEENERLIQHLKEISSM